MYIDWTQNTHKKYYIINTWSERERERERENKKEVDGH